AYAIAQLHRAALELDHRDGDTVDVDHQIGPTLMAAFQRDLFGQCEIVAFRVLPIDQVHVFMGLAGGQQYLDRIAQQVIHPHVGLIESIAAHLGGRLQLQERSGDMLLGIAATAQVGAQKLRLDAAVSFTLAPVPEEAIAQASLLNGGCEQPDDTALCLALGARYSVSHGILSCDGASCQRLSLRSLAAARAQSVQYWAGRFPARPVRLAAVYTRQCPLVGSCRSVRIRPPPCSYSCTITGRCWGYPDRP